MENEKMMSYILDAYPYPIVFVDCEHIIRYMNKRAKYHYYDERGYRDLVGKSVFDCHNNPQSHEMIKAAVEKLKKHGNEIYLMVNVQNQRVIITPVRNEDGELVGYFERFEMNLEK